MKTHWKKVFNPNYLGTYAFDGKDMTVTITGVRQEEVTNPDGKTETLPVLHLKEVQPLILNKTNGKTLAKLHGNYIEDWVGKQITLYVAPVKVGREMTEGVRVRPVQVRKEKLNAERFDKMVAAIQAGTFPKDRAYDFDLTDEQKKTVDAL